MSRLCDTIVSIYTLQVGIHVYHSHSNPHGNGNKSTLYCTHSSSNHVYMQSLTTAELISPSSLHTLGFLPSNVTSMCPFISQTMYTESISESVPIGTTLLTIAATGNTLTYTLVPLPGISNFHVDPSTGNITLSVSLDYETTTSYVFAVTVGNVTCTQTVLIYIDVIDENDHSPECTESRLYTHVPDNSTEGYLVSLNCTDGDNYPLRYEILSGNEIGIFAINAQGEVAVTAILDYENKTLYELSIIVSDSGLLPEQNTTVDIFVIVDPVNEYRPDFENDAIELYISESAGIGALVGHISASDLDSGEDGSITYTIVSEDESDVFAICSQTGNIYISRMLDYESISTYQFRVMASDTSLVETSRLSSTATVTVHVLDSNDHSPMFTKSVYYAQVPEDTETASEILQVVCLDEDSGSNQEVNYTIMSGNEGGNFGISSQGIITFDSSILLNFDDAGTILYELTVECKDSGQPQLNSQSLVILEVTSVNERDPIPQFIEFTASIGEDTSPGTSIAHIQANDQDRGLAGVIIYSLNFNSDCPDELLYIDSATGMVFLISPLDYETGLVYVDCVVTVRDSQPPVRASETDLVITVTDVNDEPPVCSPSAQTFSLPEDTPVGYSLTFTCNDADSTSLQYSVTNGYSVFPFELSPSGTLVTLVLQSELDYENNTMHILPVEVSDGDFTTKVTVYISVFGINEHTPIFLNDSFECSVSEATELGAIVCETGAYDEDSGIDGVVMYQMANSIGTFATDLHTGIIFLTDSLDYETTKEYNITIQAFDSGNPSLSSSVQAHIIVIDENDNVPMTQPLIFAKISENALSGSHVTALDCFDLDDGRNAETDFEITGTFIFLENGEYLLASNQTFTMSSPGNLTLNESLDYEAAHLYKVVVTCKDHGVLPLSSCATITIEVLPENEFNPTFSQHARSISIPENTPIGTSVFQVIASDNDSGKDGSIQYSLHSNDSLFLAMDSSSGIVSVVSPMDCLRGTVYNTTIIATDGGRIPLSAETMLTVYIANCSLGHVTSEKAVYIASVHETAHIGTSILNVACNSTRADLLSERYTTTYEILSAESSLFAIDSTSGELSVASSLDYETSISHVVTLQCYDPNNPHSLASFTAYIAILPENEHPPIFPSFSYSIEIPENTTLGASILTVEAHDMDNGQDGILSYSIRDLDKPVGIDPVSGAVYLTDFLDRETTDHFTFTVNVQDTPIEQEYTKHAHVDVAVLISDSNDNNPQCERNFYHVSVSPWTRIGTSLVNLTCSDRDLEQNSQLEYTLTDNSTTELFRIDRYTGEAILLQVLDPDISVVYHVPVSVRDMGEPPLSITVVIIVDVQDSVSTEDDEVDVTDVISQTQTEGFENAVTILLQDLSLQLVGFGISQLDHLLHFQASSI